MLDITIGRSRGARAWNGLYSALAVWLALSGMPAVSADTATPVVEPPPAAGAPQTAIGTEVPVPPGDGGLVPAPSEAERGGPPETHEPSPSDMDAGDNPGVKLTEPTETPQTESPATPPSEVNVDAFQVNGAAGTPLTVEAGATVTVRYDYAVTTTRVTTTVHASLIDPVSGAQAAAWTMRLDGAASTTSASASLTDVSATMPGSTIPIVVTITADSQASSGDTVLLRLWSEVHADGDPAPIRTDARAERYVQVLDSGAPESGVATCDIAGSSTPTIAAESLDFGTLSPDGDGYPIVERQITITITNVPLACEAAAGPWVIRVSFDGMLGPQGETIPAHAMTYIGESGRLPDVVTPVSGPVALGRSPATIATVDGNVEPGTSWTVAFALSPPGALPPGDYAAPVMLEVVAAG